MTDEEVKEHQAKLLAELQKDLATAAPRKNEYLRAYRTALLVSLIKARNQRKLSQAQLAKIVGTSQPVIARIESGKGNPSLNTLLKLARALDVNLLFYK